ncbi:HlyD family secretion protein [Roseiarcus fermentans]|nr:HlyD family secretion protein [Roseiarcus fermentans]
MALNTLRPAQRTEAPAAGGATGRALDGPAADAALEAPRREESPGDDRPGRRTEPLAVPAAPQEPPAAATGRRGRRWTLVVGGLFAAAFAGSAGVLYLDHSGRFQSTDDAFFAARQFAIAPKVAGYVVEVPVSDNQHVMAGDPIARLDERDYRNAVALAEAQVAAAEAGVRTVDAQLSAQRAQIDAAQAQVAQAQAALVFAGQQADRYQQLAKSGSGAVMNAQQSSSQFGQQQAGVEAAEATLKLAQRQVDTLNAQRATAEASLAQGRAQLDQARLNLSYTTVTAAQPGRVVALSAAVGQLAQPGAALAMIVPDGIWVAANFKETQLAAMRPGQPVEIAIDAYPGRSLHGHVDSVQPGSGTAFSLLPAENATGNYVKIVQRVPVKVTVDDLPADLTLGLGMSVTPTVRTDPAPSLIERLTAAAVRFGGLR